MYLVKLKFNPICSMNYAMPITNLIHYYYYYYYFLPKIFPIL